MTKVRRSLVCQGSSDLMVFVETEEGSEDEEDVSKPVAPPAPQQPEVRSLQCKGKEWVHHCI